MLQQDTPEDFVIATGQQYSVRQFITWAAADLGMTLEFSGSGADEIATVAKLEGHLAPRVSVGDVVMRIDPRFFRPTEADSLLGDPTRAREKLGWRPEIGARQMCREMVEADYRIACRQAGLQGTSTPVEIA
jgi:GDPmannose 4,6-dehydratase